MRRSPINIIVALALMLVLLTSLANAQNVSVELIPITYPIAIPSTGGTFDYLLTVTNLENIPINSTVWCMVTLPNGRPWGPAVGPVTQTLSAGQIQSYYRIQSVPLPAPTGTYTFSAYIGVYPDSIWASDSFAFEKQPSGTELWVTRYDGPIGYFDAAEYLALDAAGNVYVTGGSFGNGTDLDYATIKYDNNGNQLWVARYNGPGNGSDWASFLALDSLGNIYVIGRSYGSEANFDYATIKYDNNGNQLWEALYNGPGNGDDYATSSLALDPAGNVYVTGRSQGSGTSSDYATIKYDNNGNQLWVARYNGPGNGYETPWSIALDPAGNVYVTGQSVGSDTSYDYATIKYDNNGNQLWEARYNGSGNNADVAYSIALDADGNVYVTGGCNEGETLYDYTTIKYDNNGNQLWVARYNGPGNGSDWAVALLLDFHGNVYITGQSVGSGTSNDYATIKYDNNGNQLWVARYNGPDNFWDVANSLALDPAGNVYVTGQSGGSGTSADYATIKYDNNGNQLWEARYNAANYADIAECLAVDSVGNVYVTGSSSGTGIYEDYATIKYSGGNLDNWLPVEATVFGQPLPQEYRLEQNHPNPFNAATAISYQLPVSGLLNLTVYDISGRRIAELVNGWRDAGTHEFTFDASNLPSGIYIYRLTAGSYTATNKMMLVK